MCVCVYVCVYVCVCVYVSVFIYQYLSTVVVEQCSDRRMVRYLMFMYQPIRECITAHSGAGHIHSMCVCVKVRVCQGIRACVCV